MHKKIVINGQFAARRVTGQERFAFEIISELDKICKKGQYSLVVPKNASNIPHLTNIPVVKFGKAKGSLWEQTFLALYMLFHTLPRTPVSARSALRTRKNLSQTADL